MSHVSCSEQAKLSAYIPRLLSRECPGVPLAQGEAKEIAYYIRWQLLTRSISFTCRENGAIYTADIL